MPSFSKRLTGIALSICSGCLLLLSGCKEQVLVPVKPAPPAGASGHDTPITIGGGAMTFYLNEQQAPSGGRDWSPPVRAGVNDYCANVSDASQIVLSGFVKQGTTTLAAQPPDITLKPGQATWKILLAGSKHRVLLTAGVGSCSSGSGTPIHISVVPAAGSSASFYPTELPNKHHNRRFQDRTGADCQTDADTCESLSGVLYGNDQYVCDGQLCAVAIGKPL